VDDAGDRLREVPVMRVLLGFLLLAPGMALAAYPLELPGELAVHEAMRSSPAMAAAREAIAYGQATQRLRRAGPYGLDVAATGEKRRDLDGKPYHEQQYELLRTFRLPGKGVLDRAIGEQAAAAGGFAYEDAWHEAARVLLADWCEWLRARASAGLLGQQADLLREQARVVARRVAAGDAPRIEQQLAEAEVERQLAAAAAAAQRAGIGRERLRAMYPQLAFPSEQAGGVPPEVDGDDATWVQRVVGENHEIELADARAAGARLKAQRAGRDRVGDPTLGLKYSSTFDGSRDIVALTVTLPIGSGARNAEYALAQSEAARLAAEARVARMKVEGDARQDLLVARASRSQWQQLERAAAQDEANAATVAHGYALGEFGLAQLLSARRSALAAAEAAAMARLDALEGWTRLNIDAHYLWTAEGPGPR
jgi:outer membrane protein, heavy metal efflux system